ncbi:hypothetical protein [Streptomyces sp. TRM64462]|uniref:hypothetical protein n=1 Tax=Streptomyces sp. TRM64462 TaxID=2741726 RepID=UPI001586145F|nr:hypothetical protein [Streptomyces sp. TRM64462]
MEMPEVDAYGLLTEGFREVSRILDESNSTLAVDPILAELAGFAEQHPESDGLRLAMMRLLDSRAVSASAEAVQYFAHKFRWGWLEAEVRSRYLESVTKLDRRMIRHYERMLESFRDDWEDRDLFPSLGN